MFKQQNFIGQPRPILPNILILAKIVTSVSLTNFKIDKNGKGLLHLLNRSNDGLNVMMIKYCNLGTIYHGLVEFKKAIKYHQRHLEIAKEVGDKAGEGRGYGNLGNAYHGLGQFQTAIEYHQRHLEIAKEVGDKAGEGGSYANLGNAYHGLGQL